MSHTPFAWSREHLNSIILEGKHKIFEKQEQIDAFLNIDRADFIPSENLSNAYVDKEVEIGFGQTIDKPTVVAQQIKLLDPKEGGRYLDIGAGSGYTAALIAQIVGPKGRVIAIDRILFLIHKMRENIEKYPNLTNIIEIAFKDGSEGYLDEAPYDGILISAVIENIPESIFKQLKLGGRIVIPTSTYDLKVITKVDQNNLNEKLYPGYVFNKIQEGVE